MNWIIYLLAAGAGALNPAQAGANAQLRKSIDQSLPAAMVVYLSGLLGIFLLQVFLRQPWATSEKLAQTPWWAWTGGLLSIGATLAGITFARQMGSGVFTGISVTASIVTSILFDHFGLLGFKVHPVSWPRLAGGALMVAGLWLVARF